MCAQTVTGKGQGSSGKFTSKELSALANAPNILVAGRTDVDSSGNMLSPPTPSSLVTLPTPLPGSASNYVVILTGLNTGPIYIGSMDENANGDFYRFSIFADNDGTAMYIVIKVGSKPNV